MKSPNEDKLTEYILIWFGIIPVILAALTVAPFLSDGLAGIVKGLTHSMNNPINIQWCADSPKAILGIPCSLRHRHWGIFLHAPQLPQGRRTRQRQMG